MQTRGFTLVEVLVATALLMTAALGGVHLMAFATRGMHVARTQGTSALAAAARLDQLRSLRFDFDADGHRVTDQVTDLTVDPPAPGGNGLAPASVGTLESNVSGYVDYLDGSGAWVGNGATPPREAVFVRRWAVEAPVSPDLLVLQVRVRHLASAGGRHGETRLVTARVRVRR